MTTTRRTGRAEYDAERDVIRAAAVTAREALVRPAWHGRQGLLLDACAGVTLTPQMEGLLRFLSSADWSTAAGVALITELRRGPYPAIDDSEQPDTIQGELDTADKSDLTYRPGPVDEA